MLAPPLGITRVEGKTALLKSQQFLSAVDISENCV